MTNVNNSFTALGLAGIGAVILPFLLSPEAANAEDLTSRVVLQKFSSQEFASYTAGMVEGFAYARYLKDKEATEGMACIYDWFYKDNKKTLLAIMAGFAEYGDSTPGAVISGLLTKECGE